MKNNSAAIFIPARLNSTRFPNKILTQIDGKPMVVHILERAREIGLCDCYVACCCEEVKNIVEEHGGKAIVTNPNLQSGSDRVFAAAETLPNKPEYIINLQGDMPIFDRSFLIDILEVLEKDNSIDMTTPAVFKKNIEELRDEKFVKPIFNNMEKNKPGRAIYFSRTIIPHEATWGYSHIGIYAYRYASLKKFIGFSQSFLEKAEKLEQLRAIQNEMKVWVVPVTGDAASVDVKEDLNVVFNLLKKEK
ncbi:MAG: 3-deoxy-manno-octulosonate cytidylyltransferase [Holosporales bacterium]|jgi:3-deoxy-manno-octulosonate cytidylyltransferase (CMP-KDO synthetase)|nr:3-deoxy-manno-octulosonate cytidylyltransferase [Holosporales bacterium]